MPTTNADSAEEVLTCPQCGGKTMLIYPEENEVQNIKCAGCGILVAFTSQLIRVL
jgi:Zn ribbon nucleic-acid-binding protein